MRLSHSLALVVIGFALAGCGGGPDLTTGVVMFTMSPDGNQQESETSIRVTEFISVRLPLESGTGYEWTLATPLGPDAPVGLATTEREAPGAPETIVIGGRTWYVITFVGQTPGSSVIDLQYLRPWESAPPAKTYRLSVVVTK